jgi:hypothetical protein
MKSSAASPAVAFGLIVIGIAIGAAGIYVGETDDAPGAALIGIILMLGAMALGIRIMRRRSGGPSARP